MDAEAPAPDNVSHMFEADPKVVERLSEILDLYRKGEAAVMIVVVVSPEGVSDWRFFDAQGAGVSELGRAKLYLGMIDDNVRLEAWGHAERQKI